MINKNTVEGTNGDGNVTASGITLATPLLN